MLTSGLVNFNHSKHGKLKTDWINFPTHLRVKGKFLVLPNSKEFFIFYKKIVSCSLFSWYLIQLLTFPFEILSEFCANWIKQIELRHSLHRDRDRNLIPKRQQYERHRHSNPSRFHLQEVRQIRRRKAPRCQCLRRRCLCQTIRLRRRRHRGLASGTPPQNSA